MFEENSISYLTTVITFLVVAVPIILGFIVWLTKTFQKVSKLSGNMDKILAEFAPNGGGSLRDAINRIEWKTNSMDLVQKAYIDVDSNVAIFQTDDKGFFVWANKAYLKLVGRTMDQILGFGWLSSIPQNERDKIRFEFDSSVREKRNFEYCFHFTSELTKGLIPVKCKTYGLEKSGYVGFVYINDEVS